MEFPDMASLDSIADGGFKFWKGSRFYATAWSEDYGAVETFRPAEVWVDLAEVPIHVCVDFHIQFVAEKFGKVEKVSSTVGIRRDVHAVRIKMKVKKLQDISKFLRLETRE